MEEGKIYKLKENKYRLVIGIIDLGALGKAPNCVEFKTRKEAEEYWEKNKEQFNGKGSA
jgi:hypothetical protein